MQYVVHATAQAVVADEVTHARQGDAHEDGHQADGHHQLDEVETPLAKPVHGADSKDPAGPVQKLPISGRLQQMNGETRAPIYLKLRS